MQAHTATRLPIRAALVLAAAILMLTLPASGAPIDDAKMADQIGEQADGYLGVRPGAPQSAQALAASINFERSAKYTEIAANNGTTAAVVAALAGQKLAERAAAGEWVRDASGNWTQK